MSVQKRLGLEGAVDSEELGKLARRTYLQRYKQQYSVDRLLCNPAVAAEFTRGVRHALGIDDTSLPDEAILWKLLSVRKAEGLKQGDEE